MKTKNFNKKLALNKKTVSNLSHSQMVEVIGGKEYTYNCCETFGECVSNYSVCDCPIYTFTACCCESMTM